MLPARLWSLGIAAIGSGPSGKVAIGRVVIRTKEYLAAIRPYDRALALETMFFPDEIAQMPALLRIRGGIVNRRVGPAADIGGKSFQSQKANFKAEVLAKGFDQPWGMAFLPDGRIIFTERAGRIRFLNKDGSVSAPVKFALGR